jgi:hypothetical protein
MYVRMKRVVLAVVLAASVSPALAAGASNFTLVNGTNGALQQLSIRRAGSQDWRNLGSAPSPGGRSSMNFSDPDCAFDIRANVPGAGPITWAGVNLCGAKSVILNRDGSAGAWVDYDQ